MRLVRSALFSQSSKAANPNNLHRRLIHVASSTTLVVQIQNASSTSRFSSLRSSSADSLYSKKWTHFGGQKRTLFIQTQSTPNPSSLMFYPGKPVMEVGSSDFPNARTAMNSPLAKALFGIDGITRVFYGSDFVTVSKSEDYSWDLLKPQIFAAIMDFYSSGQLLFLDSKTITAKDCITSWNNSFGWLNRV